MTFPPLNQHIFIEMFNFQRFFVQQCESYPKNLAVLVTMVRGLKIRTRDGCVVLCTTVEYVNWHQIYDFSTFSYRGKLNYLQKFETIKFVQILAKIASEY